MSPSCSTCNAEFQTNEMLYSHASMAHASVTTFRCYACNRLFSLNPWRKHIRKEHSEFNNSNVGQPNFVAPIETTPMDISNDDVDLPADNEIPEVPNNSFEYSYNRFIIKDNCNNEGNHTKNPSLKDLIKEDSVKFAAFVYSLADVSRKRSFQFISSITTFLNGNAFCYLENQLITRLEELGETPNNLKKWRKDFDMMRNPLESVRLNSEYNIKKYFEKNNSLILPKQITVGERDDYRKTNKDNDEGPVEVKIPVQIDFIPIHRVLKNFFEIPNVFKNTMDYITSLESSKIILSNFIQGQFWQNRKRTFDTSKIILPLFVYYDDYETNNPLGSHAGLGKVGAVYATIPCLPPIYQSKMENIFLFEVFNTLDRQVLGSMAVFRDAIKELEFLKESGVEIKVNNKEYVIYFHFVLLLGDNLGMHSILGYSESFMAIFFCRICLVRKSERGSVFDEDQCTRRNRTNYEEGIAVNDISKTGIRRACIFHDANLDYHATENISIDIMHDLESIIKYDLTASLNYFIKEKFISLTLLKDRLNGFFFDDNDRKSKPPEITANHLSQNLIHMSAAETFCFLRIFGLLISDKIPEDDDYWKVFLLLKFIYEICFAKKLHKDTHHILKLTISEYLQLLNQLFGAEYLKPKHHFLVHYPTVLREMGPLCHLSSMRFEGKHFSGKLVAKASRNRTNVCHSIALKEQYTLNYRFLNNPSLSNFVSGPLLRDCDTSEDVTFFRNEGIICSNKIIRTKWLEFLGSRINSRTILVTPTVDGFQFTQVNKIYVTENYSSFLILGSNLECNFHNHSQSYKLSNNSSTVINRAIEYKNIHNFFNTYKIKLNSEFYILTKWF